MKTENELPPILSNPETCENMQMIMNLLRNSKETEKNLDGIFQYMHFSIEEIHSRLSPIKNIAISDIQKICKLLSLNCGNIIRVIDEKATGELHYRYLPTTV